MSDNAVDLLGGYKRIQNKLGLKKKSLESLLKRPNFSEGVDLLSQLITSIKREQPDGPSLYVAFLYLAVARCEESLKNVALEAAAINEAGIILLESAITEHSSSILGFEESLNEATNCYLQAIKIYMNQKRVTLAASLYIELATMFKKLCKYGDAAEYFQQAAELQQSEGPLSAIFSLEEAVDCHVKLRDYKSSCAELIWIIKLASEANSDLVYEQEEGNIINISNNTIHSTSSNLSSGNSNTSEKNIIGSNYSVFTKILVDARISLILLLILEGEMLQAQDFVKQLSQEATNYGIVQISLDINLLENLVVASDLRNIEVVRGIQRTIYQSLTNLQNLLMELIVNDLICFKKIGQI